jgi:hypothetical protein
MSDSLPAKESRPLAPSMHPALSGANGPPMEWPTPTILVCPLPLSALTADYLLPELSHEIKTPLSGIMGLAQIMQRQTGAIAAREYQYADLIYQKSQQLLIAINDLLDLTQLSTRQFVLHLHPVELNSVLNTARQTAQRSTGLVFNWTNLSEGEKDPTEHWIIADPSRLEQLFTHLINALLLQSPIERHTELSFRSSGDWMAITLSLTPLQLSENELIHLGWPYQPSSSQVSSLPSRSDAVLKGLLARQLTQLHGGDIAWNSDAAAKTSVTVCLPCDLTRTTQRVRSPSPAHLLLIVSQRTTDLYEVTQALMAQGKLVMTARSLSEATEKLQILSPTLLVMDHQFAQACGWNAIRTWLNERLLAQNPFTLVWLGDTPPDPYHNEWPSSALWSWPLTTQSVLLALKQFPVTLESRSPVIAQTAVSSASFTVLQLGSLSVIATPESIPLKLLNQLSQDYGCSILAVDNADQAELLARIWKPKIMICPGPLPPWVQTFSKTSCLRELPLILLEVTKQNQLPHNLGSLSYKIYSIHDTLQTQSIKTMANHLYLYMTDFISENLEK